MAFPNLNRRGKLAWIVAIAGSCVAIAMAFSTSQSRSAERSVEMKNATYEGRTISSDAAARRGLSCIQEASGVLNCFDSKQQLLDSPIAAREEAKANGASTATVAKKRRKSAKISADCNLPANAQAISEHGDFNYNVIGWNVIGYARQNWYNMTGEYRNAASSVSAGDHSGYLADNVGGGTPRLRLEVRQCERWLSRVYFNDRAESRYRN